MISILHITEDFVNVLKTVKSNTFPMLVKEGTSLPFITYERLGIDPHYTKCGAGSIMVSFQVNIITKDYMGGLNLLDLVINMVTRMNSQHDLRYQVQISSSSEQAYDDGYVQTVNFDLEVTYAQ